jgi:hypothetical protein
LRLPRHPADRRDQFFNLVPLISHIAGGECGGDTMRHVIAENLLLDFMQGGADSMNLRQYIHAIAIVVDHPKQTANLTFDAPEAPGDFHFGSVVHGNRSLIPYL